MGLCCCKPSQLFYKVIDGNHNNRVDNRVPHNRVEKTPSKKDLYLDVLKKVNQIVKELLDNNGWISKPGEKPQVIGLDDDAIMAELNIEDFIFADEGMTQEELEDILSSCSPSTNSTEEPNSPTVSETEQLLRDGVHIALCRDPNQFQQLKILMESAMRLRIISEYIDSEDSDGNSAIVVALLCSNTAALMYLLKKCFARIPLYITVRERHYLYLIYLAQNPDLRVIEDQRKFILDLVMDEFRSDCYDRDSIKEYFTTLDPSYQQSLLHFLVELCLTGQSPTQQTIDCIHMCIDLCPESIFVHCQINEYTEFRIDVVGRILCIANIHNVEVAVKLVRYIESKCPGTIDAGRQFYTRILDAYMDMPDVFSKLHELFI